MLQCSFRIAAVHQLRSIPIGGMMAERTKQSLIEGRLSDLADSDRA